MRIKKKHVLKESLILEGLLIDDLNTIDPLMRKALKNLHRRFKDTSMWDIDTYRLTDEIHEEWLLPLETAYKIVQTYVYKRDYLFKEHNYTEDTSKSNFFGRYSSRFMKKYRDSLDNERIGGEDNRWGLNFGGVELPFEPHFWDSFDGFTLYLPVDWDLRYNAKYGDDDSGIDYDIYSTLVRVGFDWENQTFTMIYSTGDKENKQEGIIIENEPFEYMEGEVSYDSVNAWIEGLILNKIKPILDKFEFPSVEDDGTGM
jgi:hypothetical protein